MVRHTRTHTQRKEITYSTQRSSESRSKAPYDSPSHRIGGGRGERTASLEAPKELNRWMDGRTER